MAQERFIPFLPQTRQVDMQQMLKDVEAPPLELPAPSEEEARALDLAFADSGPEERSAVLDGLTIAAAGILLHDLAKDTLASPEDEEETPAVKPKKQEPDPE